MGCYIRAFVETVTSGYPDLEAEIFFPQDYGLFTVLAGVRNQEFEEILPVAEPKGLPQGSLSFRLLGAYKRDERDAHSASFLTLKEVAEADRRYRYHFAGIPRAPVIPGTSFYSPLAAPLAFMRALGREGVEVRLVFWFDG